MKRLTALLVALGVLLAGLLVSCATAPKQSCNPIMVQCNEADYPPLTDTLPKSPIPKPMQPGVLR